MQPVLPRLSSRKSSPSLPTFSTFSTPSSPRGSRPGSPSSPYSSPKLSMADEKRGDAYKLVVDEDEVAKKLSPNPNAGGPVLPTFLGDIAVGPGSMLDNLANNPALPVACYCFASILMTVVNKFVVSGRHFSMNFLLLTIQSAVCVSCVSICKLGRVISYRDFDRNDARKWFPISFLLVVVIYTGSKALQFLTIPVYTIFKNLTIILIAYGEVIWFSGTVTRLTLLSFGLMVASSLVAAWSDISTALFAHTEAALDVSTGREVISAQLTMVVTKYVGYIWMLVNCLASAAYVLAMRKRIKVTNFKDWDTMFYNNLLSIPVLVIFSCIFEDWSSESLERNFPVESRRFLLFAMAFSGAAAVFISYTTAWCVRTTSSTTYSMVGALNKLPVAASGMIFFGDPITFGSVTAVSMGFVAGLVYAAAKQVQSNSAKSNGGLELSARPR